MHSYLELSQDVPLDAAILLLGSHLLHVFQGRILLQDQTIRTEEKVALTEELADSLTAKELREIPLLDLA
jgi:hypothetical protein